MAVNLGQNLDRKYGIKSSTPKETDSRTIYYVVVQEHPAVAIAKWIVTLISGALIGFSIRGLI